VSNALEGLRQFYSETVGIAVIPADELAEIAARSFDAAALVSACLEARGKAPPHMRCSGRLQRLDDVAAYLFVFLKPVRETEYNFLQRWTASRPPSASRRVETIPSGGRWYRVRVMADYGSAGLWDHDGAPLDPNRLPLSPKLRERLARWCAQFRRSFEREIDLDTFAAEGRTATQLLAAAMGRS
jgi:hypothetical protein